VGQRGGHAAAGRLAGRLARFLGQALRQIEDSPAAPPRAARRQIESQVAPRLQRQAPHAERLATIRLDVDAHLGRAWLALRDEHGAQKRTGCQ